MSLDLGILDNHMSVIVSFDNRLQSAVGDFYLRFFKPSWFFFLPSLEAHAQPLGRHLATARLTERPDVLISSWTT